MNHRGVVGVDGFVTLLISNVVLIATLGITLFFALSYVLRIARNTSVRPPADILLVVLGMRLNEGVISEDYALRLKRTARIYGDGVSRKILAVGGITDKSMTSEASRGREYMASLGVDPENILLEDASHHTLENLRNVREIMKAKGFNQFAIITNRYHLARSQVIAAGLGLKPFLCAAEDGFTMELKMLPRLFLEAYYIHWYRTGSIWSRITFNKKSLERIR